MRSELDKQGRKGKKKNPCQHASILLLPTDQPPSLAPAESNRAAITSKHSSPRLRAALPQPLLLQQLTAAALAPLLGRGESKRAKGSRAGSSAAPAAALPKSTSVRRVTAPAAQLHRAAPRHLPAVSLWTGLTPPSPPLSPSCLAAFLQQSKAHPETRTHRILFVSHFNDICSPGLTPFGCCSTKLSVLQALGLC